MPEKETLERVEKDKREGKAASTQAGEFVREEIEHVREGKHGARSTKQVIAIGLSKARRAGVKLRPPKKASKKTQEQAARDTRKGKSTDKGKNQPSVRAQPWVHSSVRDAALHLSRRYRARLVARQPGVRRPRARDRPGRRAQHARNRIALAHRMLFAV